MFPGKGTQGTSLLMPKVSKVTRYSGAAGTRPRKHPGTSARVLRVDVPQTNLVLRVTLQGHDWGCLQRRCYVA